MSVNMTVASTRSSGRAWRVPVRNSSISSIAGSKSPVNGTWSSPSNSTRRASGICSAISRAPSMGATRSPLRCRISVGIRIVGRMSRTSISKSDAITALAIAGLALARWNRPHARCMSRILGERGGEDAQQGAIAPGVLGLGEHQLNLLVGGAPRDVGVGTEAWGRAVEDQRGRALRIRRGEEHARRAALRDPVEGRPLHAGGIHHRLHVVHPLLQRGWAAHGVRQAGATLVEDHDARKRAEPLEQVGNLRHLPVVLDVRDEARDEDQIQVSLAEHLVRDVSVAAERVSGARRLGHLGFRRVGRQLGRARSPGPRSRP